MNCAEMRNLLTGLPGEFREEELSPAGREHLKSCSRCRQVFLNEHSLRERINAAGRMAPPGEPYWGTILPRVRERTTRRRFGDRLTELFGSARFVMQGAGLAAMVLFLLTVNITDPHVPAPAVTIASLSETELLDLRSSVRYTGLLDHSTERGEENVSTLTDFLAELLAVDEGADLYASVDPELVLDDVDDASLGEIVNILSSKK
jgi:hypothetical protein